MGAWIETGNESRAGRPTKVAPYVGAWIETKLIDEAYEMHRSHPTWVRGLKPGTPHFVMGNDGSHPTWVRGLKLADNLGIGMWCTSHPTWVRGLKL